MNQLQQLFNYQGSNVRVVMKNNEPWFAAKDVCDVLGITNPTDAVKRLDEDERTRFNLGRQGETNFVNEPGLYGLVLGSRKPEAKEFKRWIKHDVLPSIRQTGSYSIEQKTPSELIAMIAQVNVEQEQRITAVEQKVYEVDRKLDERITLDYYQQSALLNAKNKRVEKLWNEEGGSLGIYDTRKKLHAAAWRDVRKVFGVASYKDVRQKQFEEAMKYVEGWRPMIV